MSKKISRRKRDGYQVKHSFVHKISVPSNERKDKEPQISKNENSLNADENNYLKKDLKLFLILGITFIIIVSAIYLLIALTNFKIFNLGY